MAPLRQQKGNYRSCNFSYLAEAEHSAIGKLTKVNFHLDNFFIDTSFESLKHQKTLSSEVTLLSQSISGHAIQ